MKKLIFTYEGYANTNIGDYIQSLAALQFINDKENIIYWQRDNLQQYNGEDASAVMNGWFSHKPEQWPPSSKIKPLFVAFHINSASYKFLLSDESIRYLKQFQPIGCRDKTTANKLKEHGVDAYFSSCLTTTLGYSYHSTDSQRNTIYIVDPVHFIPEVSYRIRRYLFIFDYIRNFKGINRYIRNLIHNNPYSDTWKKNKLNVLQSSTRAYILLKQILSPSDLKNIVILTQYHTSTEIPSNEERFKRAEQLLNFYSNAKLVLTSRIHCALPCLGLGTPVIFLQNLDDSIESTCRFDGLLDLLNVIKFRKNKIVNSTYKFPLNISTVKNPKTFKSYRDQLIYTLKKYYQ